MSSKQSMIQCPALGRPFELGMLYDAINEKLIPGITLWNAEKLKEHVSVKEKPLQDFKVITEDNIKEKCSALNIDGTLKLSVLAGLFNLEGSAKYLRDTNESSRSSRVTLHYRCETRFEQLTMEHLAKANYQHPEVFENQSATHVVTGITYGANAFFMFEQELAENTDQTTAEGYSKIMIEAIKILPSLEGSGKMDLTSSDKLNQENISCTYQGDFYLERVPKNYEEAVKVYHELPSLLGENKEKAVPVEVFLFPLKDLDSRAAQITREISAGFVKQVEELFEELERAKSRCIQMKSSHTFQYFGHMQSPVEQFHGAIKTYETHMKNIIQEQLPKLRSGNVKEKALVKDLLQQEKSPFNVKAMQKWLQKKEIEMKMLASYLEDFQSVKATFLKDIGDLEKHRKQRELVCIQLSSTEHKDDQIEAMEALLETGKPVKKSHLKKTSKKLQWYENAEITDALRNRITMFKNFASLRCNKSIPFAAFVDAHDSSVAITGAVICLYKNGQKIVPDFSPPKPVTRPIVEAEGDENAVKTSWSFDEEDTPNIKCFKVLYRKVLEKHWKEAYTEGKPVGHSQELKIPVDPASHYVIKVQPVCEVGLGEESETSDEFVTRPKPASAQRRSMLTTSRF